MNWYFQHEGSKVGPLTSDQLREYAQSGKITAQTLVTRDGLDGWVAASQVAGLLENQEPAAVVTPNAAAPTTEQRSGNTLPLILSSVAVILAVTAIIIAFLRDSGGSGLDAYDFSTPEDSIFSVKQIILDKNWQALMELQAAKGAQLENIKEQASTLKVHKESSYKDKKILFVTYDKNGITEYNIETFEKDSEGRWLPSYVYVNDIEDATLKKAISEWKEKSGRVEAVKEG